MEQIIFHIDVNSAYLSWTAVERIEKWSRSGFTHNPGDYQGAIRNPDTGLCLQNLLWRKNMGFRQENSSAFRKCPDLVMAPPNHKMYQEYAGD